MEARVAKKRGFAATLQAEAKVYWPFVSITLSHLCFCSMQGAGGDGVARVQEARLRCVAAGRGQGARSGGGGAAPCGRAPGRFGARGRDVRAARQGDESDMTWLD